MKYDKFFEIYFNEFPDQNFIIRGLIKWYIKKTITTENTEIWSKKITNFINPKRSQQSKSLSVSIISLYHTALF